LRVSYNLMNNLRGKPVELRISCPQKWLVDSDIAIHQIFGLLVLFSTE
jgi:hypothetical protein